MNLVTIDMADSAYGSLVDAHGPMYFDDPELLEDIGVSEEDVRDVFAALGASSKLLKSGRWSVRIDERLCYALRKMANYLSNVEDVWADESRRDGAPECAALARNASRSLAGLSLKVSKVEARVQASAQEG